MANQAKLGEVVFSVGDLVKIHQKIIEKDKERTQIFEGMVISIKGSGENKSFTVRRIGSGNIGIERIWPLNSPWILKLEVVKKGKVRRAKLYYLRKRAGKKATKVKVLEKKLASKKPEVSKKIDEEKKSGGTRRKAGPKTSKK